MKDIIITARRLRIESCWLLGSFIVANLCNAGAIWYYGASFREMLTSFFYVLAFTSFIYLFTAVLRMLFCCGRSLILKLKKS